MSFVTNSGILEGESTVEIRQFLASVDSCRLKLQEIVI